MSSKNIKKKKFFSVSGFILLIIKSKKETLNINTLHAFQKAKKFF